MSKTYLPTVGIRVLGATEGVGVGLREGLALLGRAVGF